MSHVEHKTTAQAKAFVHRVSPAKPGEPTVSLATDDQLRAELEFRETQRRLARAGFDFDRSRTEHLLDVLNLRRPSIDERIKYAGLSRTELAIAAGMGNHGLANQIAGRMRTIDRQLEILRAFNRLSGQTLTLREFWGDLVAEEAA